MRLAINQDLFPILCRAVQKREEGGQERKTVNDVVSHCLGNGMTSEGLTCAETTYIALGKDNGNHFVTRAALHANPNPKAAINMSRVCGLHGLACTHHQPLSPTTYS